MASPPCGFSGGLEDLLYVWNIFHTQNKEMASRWCESSCDQGDSAYGWSFSRIRSTPAVSPLCGFSYVWQGFFSVWSIYHIQDTECVRTSVYWCFALVQSPPQGFVFFLVSIHLFKLRKFKPGSPMRRSKLPKGRMCRQFDGVKVNDARTLKFRRSTWVSWNSQ